MIFHYLGRLYRPAAGLIFMILNNKLNLFLMTTNVKIDFLEKAELIAKIQNDHKTSDYSEKVPRAHVVIVKDKNVVYDDLLNVGDTKQSANICAALHGDQIEYKEQFFVLILNRAHKVINTFKMSEGGLHATTVDVKTFAHMLALSPGCSVVINHNHPSGNPKPSREDELITKQLSDVATILGYNLIDHVITLPGGRFVSFADEGLI